MNDLKERNSVLDGSIDWNMDYEYKTAISNILYNQAYFKHTNFDNNINQTRIIILILV